MFPQLRWMLWLSHLPSPFPSQGLASGRGICGWWEVHHSPSRWIPRECPEVPKLITLHHTLLIKPYSPLSVPVLSRYGMAKSRKTESLPFLGSESSWETKDQCPKYGTGNHVTLRTGYYVGEDIPCKSDYTELQLHLPIPEEPWVDTNLINILLGDFGQVTSTSAYPPFTWRKGITTSPSL